MILNLKKSLSILSILSLLALITWDSRQHFDPTTVAKKMKIHSPQKNWNLFLSQHHVFHSGGILHEDDFKVLSEILEPGSAVFADLATSYYLSASAPIYIKNVHRHHGRNKDSNWGALLKDGFACYLDVPKNFERFIKFLEQNTLDAQRRPGGLVNVKYFAINLSHTNKNFPLDCLSQRRRAMLSVIDRFAKRIFEGETIVIYELSKSV